MPRRRALLPLFLLAAAVVACGPLEAAPLPTAPEPEPNREACALSLATRQPLYGDLHVHTAFSFDARSYRTLLKPADAYRFARGEAVNLPVADGAAPRTTQLDRPLDFVAVTDHVELLGEVYHCTDNTSDKYDEPLCQTYRDDVGNGAFSFALRLSQTDPDREPILCGEDGQGCRQGAITRWAAMLDAAEQAYDRSAACSFTSFAAYEYTNTHDVSNLHRNVVFRDHRVPELPPSYFEAPNPLKLWQLLKSDCKDADGGCDVLVLPHNSNLSNGNLFDPSYPGGDSVAQEADYAALRAEMEPVAEMFQHKGDSECRNGFPEVDAADDPLCDFEKLRPTSDETCGEVTGSGGMRLWGCVHRHDFIRNVLKTGLLEGERLGVNPYRLGVIGSTDTHNATPGNVAPAAFPGHVGLADDTADKRLGAGTATHDGIINNPGGLAAVWAQDNSRHSIFAALRRRETFATSGPRIRLRLFAGWQYPGDMCSAADALEQAYALGVPMGGVMLTRTADAPTFFVQAERDPGPTGQPGSLLQRIQIVKGWVADGKVFEKVYEVAGDANNGASVALTNCAQSGPGEERLCARWVDPDFTPSQRAFYYARAVENPSCRWSTRACNAIPETDRPEACSDPLVAKLVQQRAWSSPIWYDGD